MEERIMFNLEKYDLLKRAHERAVKEGKEMFTVELDGVKREFLTSYAKYLLEYLGKALPR